MPLLKLLIVANNTGNSSLALNIQMTTQLDFDCQISHSLDDLNSDNDSDHNHRREGYTIILCKTLGSHQRGRDRS